MTDSGMAMPMWWSNTIATMTDQTEADLLDGFGCEVATAVLPYDDGDGQRVTEALRCTLTRLRGQEYRIEVDHDRELADILAAYIPTTGNGQTVDRGQQFSDGTEPVTRVLQVDGAEVLSEVEEFISTYVAFPTAHARTAAALWIGHTHLVDFFESTPRLALLSPEPGSGKTRFLEVAELVCPAPMHVLSASAAAIFRTIEKQRPTLLFDEVDAIFGRRGADDSNEDLRALLNAGHRHGATVPRCVGATHDVRMFPVFAPVALAGLGDLPETLMSRSIVVRMRRRAPGEEISPFRHRIAAPIGHAIRDRLTAWATSMAGVIADAWPTMPEGVTDRPADCWEPLLAVADAAGGEWPDRARQACVAMANTSMTKEASLGIKLLADLRTIFGDADKLSTETILTRLNALEESPWGDLRGKPLDSRGLARRLRQYEVGSTAVAIGERTLRGYTAESLFDAWTRYVPPDDPQ